jgi:hypothetical protein
MKARRLLISLLLATGMVAAPLDAGAADETKAPKSPFRGTALTARTFGDTAYAKSSVRKDTLTRSTQLGAVSQPQFNTSVAAGKEVPELSGSAAGASLTLLAGGLLALTGRRKRKTPAR